MKTRKRTVRLIAMVLALSLAMCGSVFAAETAETGEPRTVNFAAGQISFVRDTGSVYVLVTTRANAYIDDIYHDVTIYKNGVWQSSDRYSDTDAIELATSIKLSAKSGDYIDVYADHYTCHNGYLETYSSHETLTY